MNCLPDRFQITLVNYGTCCYVYLLDKRDSNPTPFSSIKTSWCDTVEEAKQVAETWADALFR